MFHSVFYNNVGVDSLVRLAINRMVLGLNPKNLISERYFCGCPHSLANANR